MHPRGVRLLAAAVVLAVAGCSAPPPGPPPEAAPAIPPDPTPPDPTPPDAAPSGAPTLRRATPPEGDPLDSPRAGRATGPVTDRPYEVDGIPVVSKDHRLAASYVPPWAAQPHGLHPEVAAAFAELQTAAKASGLRLEIRSGYRSYATQDASFRRALATYPEKTARLYYAEPGASEHQTGLALDAWDGRHRGSAFDRTPQAAWLAAHAHEFGFILRYPAGMTHVTGYAGETWHLRWVGREVSAAFVPGSDLTLEEYLGLT